MIMQQRVSWSSFGISWLRRLRSGGQAAGSTALLAPPQTVRGGIAVPQGLVNMHLSMQWRCLMHLPDHPLALSKLKAGTSPTPPSFITPLLRRRSFASNSLSTSSSAEEEKMSSKEQYEHDKYWKGLSEEEFNYEYGNKRKALASFNAQGDYEKALAVAKEMEEAVRVARGKSNLMFASAVNNVALMLKNCGETELSLDKYIESLQAYQAIVGKNHMYYSATLANLGSLYKTMAEGAKGVDKIEYLQRANEALADALEIRKQLNGNTNDKESLLIAINMASVKRIEGKLPESEGILLSTLTAANQLWGEINVVTSTVYNNLAICVKLQSRFAEAESFYKKALDARKKIYGEDHNEVIVVMYNIAELYLAQGREEDSNKIQQGVLALLEKRQGGEGGGSLLDKLEKETAKESGSSNNATTGEEVPKAFNPLDVKVYHTTTRKKSKKPSSETKEE